MHTVHVYRVKPCICVSFKNFFSLAPTYRGFIYKQVYHILCSQSLCQKYYLHVINNFQNFSLLLNIIKDLHQTSFKTGIINFYLKRAYDWKFANICIWHLTTWKCIFCKTRLSLQTEYTLFTFYIFLYVKNKVGFTL